MCDDSSTTMYECAICGATTQIECGPDAPECCGGAMELLQAECSSTAGSENPDAAYPEEPGQAATQADSRGDEGGADLGDGGLGPVTGHDEGLAMAGLAMGSRDQDLPGSQTMQAGVSESGMGQSSTSRTGPGLTSMTQSGIRSAGTRESGLEQYGYGTEFDTGPACECEDEPVEALDADTVQSRAGDQEGSGENTADEYRDSKDSGRAP